MKSASVRETLYAFATNSLSLRMAYGPMPQEINASEGKELRTPFRLALYASSFAPAMVVLAIKHLFQPAVPQETFYWLAAGVLAFILPLLVIKAVSSMTQSVPVNVRKVESLEWPMVLAVVSYLLPLLDVSFAQMGAVLFVAVIVLSAVDVVPFHPVLHLFRYRFYKVEIDAGMVSVLVTRRKIIDAASIKKVRQISNGLIMEDL